jgi:hypothetical protein
MFLGLLAAARVKELRRENHPGLQKRIVVCENRRHLPTWQS